MKILLLRLLLFSLLSSCLFVAFPSICRAYSPVVPNKLFVDISVIAPGDGSSWSQALKHLSDALAVAAANPGIDSILVAQGTYSPVGGSGIVNRDSAFLIRHLGGLSIIGGYPSGGGEKSYDLYPTILTGGIGGNGTEDNSYHVLVVAGIDAGADSIVMDNLIIKDAFADVNASHDYNGVPISSRNGAGIYIHNTDKVAIRYCTIQDHGVLGWGAALYNDQSSPLIVGCTFFRNTSFGRGGAVANVQSDPVIIKCLFNENEAMDGGGAVYNTQNSRARILSCEILKSRTAGSGTSGAIFNENSTPEINGCKIAGNQTTADVGGAGVYNANATVRITNTYITGNYSATNGGGAALSNGLSSNCIVTNCSIYGNIGVNASGSIRNDASQLTITNTILTGTDIGIVEYNSAVTTVNYSLIFGWTGGGTGNLDGSLDPLFYSPPWVGTGSTWTTGIYWLKPCSPCINMGTPDTTGLHLPDSVNGMRRIQHGRIDMGVDENNITNDNGTIPQVKTTATADLVSGHETFYGNNCTELIGSVNCMPDNQATGESSLTVDFDNGQLPDQVSRFYQLTVENDPPIALARVTLYFTQAEFDAYNAANAGTGRFLLPHFETSPQIADVTNIRIRKISGTTETIIIPELLIYYPPLARWSVIFMVNSFSEFYLFTANNPALPLRLLSFDAKVENCTADISWRTVEETGVSHFELQYSSDGVAWNSIVQTAARNTTGQNSYGNSVKITAGVNYFRLKMVDMDGVFTYSKILRLLSSQECRDKQVVIYPNPTANTVYLENATPGDLYCIIDVNGRTVLKGRISHVLQQINVRQLIPGLYSIQLVNTRGTIHSMKLIKN